MLSFKEIYDYYINDECQPHRICKMGYLADVLRFLSSKNKKMFLKKINDKDIKNIFVQYQEHKYENGWGNVDMDYNMVKYLLSFYDIWSMCKNNLHIKNIKFPSEIKKYVAYIHLHTYDLFPDLYTDDDMYEEYMKEFDKE